MWLAGLNIKYFLYSFFILISLPFAIAFLKPYQKLRILTFLNPDRDPLGAGYQIIQSKIAVGSGGLRKRFFKRYSKLSRVFTRKTYRFYIYFICRRTWIFRVALVF